MTRTDRPDIADADGYDAIVLHNDGTVTRWSCARQSWERGFPADADLAEMDRLDRGRVLRHLDRHGVA